VRASSLSTSLYLPSRSGTRPLKADDQLYSPFSDFHFHLISRSPEPWRMTSCTSLLSFLNGTSSENFITFARCSIWRSRQFAEPGLYSAIAPSRIDFDGSGMSRSGSTFCTVPRPLHEGHAPNGELNEKRRGVISVSEVPQSGQAELVESGSSGVGEWGFAPSVAIVTSPFPTRVAVSSESARRRRASSSRLTTRRSTTTSIVCFFCLSRSGGLSSSTIFPFTRARRKPCLTISSICFLYSPFLPRTNGARTRKRVSSGIARMRSVICWIVWAAISLPQVWQWGF